RTMDTAVKAPEAAVRFFLRDACGASHARLDEQLSKYNFDSRCEYAEMLSRMAGPLSALESGLTAGIAPSLFSNWESRLSAHALRQDVEMLGVACEWRVGAAIDDEAGAFGALYVLEGSRLGSQVLARKARNSRDACVRGATRYFKQGARDGLWHSFQE